MPAQGKERERRRPGFVRSTGARIERAVRVQCTPEALEVAQYQPLTMCGSGTSGIRQFPAMRWVRAGSLSLITQGGARKGSLALGYVVTPLQGC